jgi:hypothetical protein
MIGKFFRTSAYAIVIRVIVIAMVLVILASGMIRPDWTIDNLIRSK